MEVGDVLISHCGCVPIFIQIQDLLLRRRLVCLGRGGGRGRRLALYSNGTLCAGSLDLVDSVRGLINFSRMRHLEEEDSRE
jgi:hypothetical protein